MDETQIIESDLAWFMRSNKNNIPQRILYGVYILRHKDILIAAKSFRTSFLLSHIAKYKIASDDDGWYLEFLNICVYLFKIKT